MTLKRSRAVQWVKLPFLSKNAFFGQKTAFFKKVHFIQKCSVTQNTVFQYVKKIFFFIQSKVNIFHQIQPNHISFCIPSGMWKNSRADLKDRKLDLEFNYNTRLCSPGHGSTLQGLVSLSPPSHCSPPLLAGTSTCLAQLSSPPPHGLLHSPSGSQSESTQSTESQMQY